AQGPAGPARPYLPVHLAQPGGGRLHRRPHRRHVRRPPGRTGAEAGSVPQPRASLYAGASGRGPGAGSELPAGFLPVDGRQIFQSAFVAGALHDRRGAAAEADRRRRRPLRPCRARRQRPGARVMSSRGMYWKLAVAGLLAIGLAGGAARADEPAMAAQFSDPPMLADLGGQGQLPPVQGRLPQKAARAAMPWARPAIRKAGGQMRLLMATPKDTRLIVVYGYARLAGYDPEYKLKPDILQSFEDDGDRVFTFHLRPGHKWSDGQPFTTEDFRYFWEDVANNTDVSPTGPPIQMLVDGEAPKVEIVDETTVRYSWSKPNPQF